MKNKRKKKKKNLIKELDGLSEYIIKKVAKTYSKTVRYVLVIVATYYIISILSKINLVFSNIKVLIICFIGFSMACYFLNEAFYEGDKKNE